MRNYKFCPYCGNKNTEYKDYFDCSNCHKKVFINSAPTASVIVIKDGKYLLCERGQEPYKGKIDVVGGFILNGEKPDLAAIREFKEETGNNPKITGLLGIYSGKYPYQGDIINTLHFQYTGILESNKIKAQDDAAELVWFSIDEMPTNISTPMMQEIILDLQKWFKKNSN